MKRLSKVIAASSFIIGSTLLMFAVSNLEFQEYTSSPLIDWKTLAVAGVVTYIPYLLYMIRKEISCRDNH